ncbi:phosphoenolpyruvate synthase [Candidatus Microgenomates bacterium]|nr:phosphoenolpyruvate synthase [Candidatus Microgenomates bacterium]
MTNKKFAVWFKEVDKGDVGIVGGKGANLGEMTQMSLPVPPGFIVTAQAYFYFLQANNLQPKIKEILKNLKISDPTALNQASQRAKKLILSGKIPPEVSSKITDYYSQLAYYDAPVYHRESKLKKITTALKEPLVAIRSSATAEDLPTASFAGQQVTFLNVKGEANVVEKVKECWASLFEPRAIFYRQEQKFDHFKVGIAVPVQKMIESDLSGVMFTIDPVTTDKKKIVIEGIYGLGEMIVQGQVTPDHYEVNKESLKILAKEVSQQEMMLIKKGNRNVELRVPKNLLKRQKLTDQQIRDVAALGKKIEKHYYHPQDIEWAIFKNKIYILQTRAVTVTKELKEEERSEEAIKKLKVILKGDPASPGIVSGRVKIITSPKQIKRVVAGDILVAPQTNPDFVPAMRKAVAIVTERGGRTSHAAIVSRELGIPCVVGTEGALKILKDGMSITVNGTTGEIFFGGIHLLPGTRRKIYAPPSTRLAVEAVSLKTATKVYVNLAEPERAAEVAKMNVDGVGLLRAEFMIAQIGVHPKKLIHDRKQNVFINTMTNNLKIFCEQFSPRPVIYRATDFKTNEYRNLIGGRAYEPEEPNPMLGYRGCFRYIHDPAVFELELEAIKSVRNKYGFKNLWLMIPFVRTVRELEEVKKLIALSGLSRSPSFKLLLMVEIPSNVILLEKFIEAGIDGVSIGSNDLTMLILGTDRDNSEVAPEFDERNEAVLWALERVIKTCHKYKVTSSICGQAPSVYPEITEKLVDWGITSVSVTPDAVDHTRQIVYEAEKRRVLKGANHG